MVSMEPIECGTRQSYSSEMECSSPASTSYGVYSPSREDDVGSPSLSDHRPEREIKYTADKQGSRRRSNASPGSRKVCENTEAEDCGVSGNGQVEGKSSNLNQGRKKQKGRKSFASKICLEQNLNSMPVESGASGGEDQDDLSNSKTFERLVQLSELEEEVLLLHKRLAEELELRAVLESALEHASGTLTNFPRHLPIFAQELLANITLLEVAVLKLEEQSSILQSEVGQARTEREIAELRHSSSESSHLGSEGSNFHPVSVDCNRSSEDDHITRSSDTAHELQNQHLRTSETPKFMETTVLESSTLLGDAAGHASDSQKFQNSWKEQLALTVRQDLRLTVPEVLEDDHATLSPWCLHHEYDSISGRQSQRLKSFWKQNPLEEEDHWIPVNDHHSQTVLAEAYCGSSQDRNGDPCLALVGYAAHDKDAYRFSCTMGAGTPQTRGPDMADLAEDDDKSSLPVAEVLWKPSTMKPSAFPKHPEKKMPKMVLLTTKPESWNFTSEDDDPRPESGSVSQSVGFEDLPCAEVVEAPSFDEKRTNYRIGVMKFREQRRQGIKNSEKVKSLSSSQTSSISSAKSGGALSPTWSPLDNSAQNENGYESQESVEIKNSYVLAASCKSPNELSEQMVRCMISIYRHLADSNNTTKDSLPSGSIQSSTSSFTAKPNSSTSSLSESSVLSIGRSPLVDLRSKDALGTDNSPDPFKSRGKIPWADIGPYAHVLEVLWLSVGKDQLEFAADSLRSFKILVEQLSRVNPTNLKHEEKLAFWINLYNALLMHAYLAYGIPRSEPKFFSLLQKAAYTVGSHSFNAATIELCLLRSKSTAHRSQFTLPMSLNKNKLTEDQSKFGIDHPESLVSFGLCSGTRSSPMVRVYTPRHVKLQLEDALHDYARAAVGISTKGKLLVPKLLHTYAREFVEDADVLDWICNLLPSNQVAAVFECIQQRRHRILGSKNFNALPIDSAFRYLFPAEDDSKRVF